MKNVVRSKFEHVEQYERFLSQHELDMKVYQLSLGFLDYHHSFLHLNNIQLHHVSRSSAMLVCGQIQDNSFTFFLPKPDGVVKVNGKTLSYNNLYYLSPKEDVTIRNYENFDSYFMAVDEGELSKYLDLVTFSNLKKYTEAFRVGKIELPYLISVRKQLSHLVNKIFVNHSLLKGQALIDVQESLLLLLTKMLSHCLSHKGVVVKSHNRIKIVKRCLDYLQQHPHEIPSIVDLSNIGFCSMRTLEYAFKSELDLSPKRFLQVRRLHQIKYDLINFQERTIKDIISHYGIVNTGRFSRDFQRLFGVMPNDLR